MTIRHTENRLLGKLDENLERRIANFLWQRRVPSLQHVEVEVTNGTAVLQGTVRSFYEKQLCLNCCQRVAGVRRIIDKLEVITTKARR